MLYKEVHSDKNFRSHALIGVFFITLSVLLGVQTYYYVNEPKVLGLQAQADLNPGGTSDPGRGDTTSGSSGSTQNQEPTPPPSSYLPPTQVPQPTAVPTAIPTRVPTAVPTQTQVITQPTSVPPPVITPSPTPVQEQIIINNPDTEIIIRNENNTLIIIDTVNDEPIASVPSVPTNPSDNTQPSADVPQIISNPSTNQGQAIFRPTPTPSNSLAVLPTTSPIIGNRIGDTSSGPSTSQGPVGSVVTDVINTLGQPFGVIIGQDPQVADNTSKTPTSSASKSSGGLVSRVLNTFVSPLGYRFRSADEVVAEALLNQDEFVPDTRPTLFGVKIGFKPKGPNFDSVPASSVRITYKAAGADSNIDEWLRKYQFQVWALGDEYIAIYRNGITTITPYPIRLGLSKLSFKVETDQGDQQVLYYPDNVWSYLSDLNVISSNSHDEPIMLSYEDDELLYRITAESSQFMFAVIPSNVCMKITISAETRDVQDAQTCSTWDSIKDFLSITI